MANWDRIYASLQAAVVAAEGCLTDAPSRAHGTKADWHIRTLQRGEMPWCATMRSDGLLVQAGHNAAFSIRLTNREPESLRRLVGFLCMLSTMHTIGGREQLHVNVEHEAKRLSRFIRCDMGPRAASFYSEVMEYWRDPLDIRRAKVEQVMRHILAECLDVGMTMQDVAKMWDEMQVQKVHDE
jgi:hypothetical protein